MRRPPSNLDDFLEGSGETGAESKAPTVAKPETPKPESRPRETKKTVTAKPTAAAPEPAPKRKTSPKTPSSERRRAPKASGSKTRPKAEETSAPSAPSERARARTVAGEAAPTVIMSVRVPLELRERLEDILAAYSGVTFSDLVIRGLENMVGEVEERHRQRTGEELPRRRSRPELLL